MQTGIGLSDYEIRSLIAKEVSGLSDVPADKLKVHISAGYGRVSCCVVHVDGESTVSLKD